MLHGLVGATSVSWIWGVGMSSVAYQLRGQHREREVGRVLRTFTAMGMVIALVVGLGMAAAGLGGLTLIEFLVAQTAFQLAAGTLVFYRREHLLALTLVPALAASVAYLVSGRPSALLLPTLVFAGSTVILALLAAATAPELVARKAVPDTADRPERSLGLAVRQALPGSAGSVGYAIGCAALMLSVDARYVNDRLDLAIAAAPLVLGMGAVEWRANRFVEKAGLLLDRDRLSGEIRADVGRLLIHELALVAGVLGALACLLVGGLYQTGWLTAAGAILIGAHVLLGCVLFLGFLLARHRDFRGVLALLGVAVVTNLLLMAEASTWFTPHGEVAGFLVVMAALLASFVIAFRSNDRNLIHFYW
jgi:hypothetical protein